MSFLPTSPGQVRRLRPLRVLLSGEDRKFARVAAFLLSRRGYEVSRSRPEDAVDAATQDGPDVVVLECGASRAAALKFTAQLSALTSPPGVVVVTAREEQLWAGVRTLPKWTALDELISEIEAASLERPRPVFDHEHSLEHRRL